MQSNHPNVRLTVTLLGTYAGILLDDRFQTSQDELLSVRIDAVSLLDNTKIPFTPLDGYLEFDPAHTPLGVLWRIGDRFEVSGRLRFFRAAPSATYVAKIQRLLRQAKDSIVQPTLAWINLLPTQPSRNRFLRLLTQFQKEQLSFSAFQEQQTLKARVLSASQRAGLARVQQRQIAIMRPIFEALARLAPEQPLISHPRDIKMIELKFSPKMATRVNKDRLGDPTYRHQLFMQLVNPDASPQLTTLPPAKPRATPKSQPATASNRFIPAPAPAKLTIALLQAQTLCMAAPNGRLTPVDTLGVRVSEFGVPEPTVVTPPRGRSRRKTAADGDNGVYFNPHLPTFLVYDAALAPLQLTPGYQGALSGTLRQVRLVTPAKRQALERAHARAIHHLRRLLARSLTAPQPELTRLTDRLAAGRLTFSGYHKLLAGLLPKRDAQLATRLDDTWAAFTQKWLALTFPAWFLDHVTAQDTIEDGAMLPLLRIDHAQLKDAAYRHRLFAQWQQNAGKKPLDHQ